VVLLFGADEQMSLREACACGTAPNMHRFALQVQILATNTIKKQPPKGDCFFMELMSRCPFGKFVAAPLHRTCIALRCKFKSLQPTKNKNSHRMVTVFVWS